MTTDANELSLNELNHVWATNLIRILWPDSDLRSVPRQFRERTQDSIRTDGATAGLWAQFSVRDESNPAHCGSGLGMVSGSF